MSHPSGVEEPEILDLWNRLKISPGLLDRLAVSYPWGRLSEDERHTFRCIVRMAITGAAGRLREKP